jgi:hypothetical protein
MIADRPDYLEGQLDRDLGGVLHYNILYITLLLFSELKKNVGNR